MAYSAVSQPLPVPTRNGGTAGSTLQVQRTVVAPERTSTLPAAVAGEAQLECERAKLVGRAVVGTHRDKLRNQPRITPMNTDKTKSRLLFLSYPCSSV